jgi:hypothetical protein
MEFSIENGLAPAVRFDLGHQCKTDFVIAVTEPGGTTAVELGLKPEEFGRSGDIRLAPGQTYSEASP